jgi:hypothetical protein
MNAGTETVKKTGKTTTSKVEKPPVKAPKIVEGKENAWAIARQCFESGQKEADVRATVHKWLLEHTSKEQAITFYATRIGYRAVRRAKAAFAAAAKKAAKAGKGEK